MMYVVEKLEKLICKHYYGDAEAERLRIFAMEEMLKSLDPYSKLIKKSDLDAECESACSGIAYRKLAKGIGYLKISSFYSSIKADMEECIEYFKSRHLEKLILDLRNNPGGKLTCLDEIIHWFVSEGKYITLHSRMGDENYFSDGKRFFTEAVVIINRYTNSCAEILAGAMQNADHIKLVGEHSKGKIHAQTCFPIDQEYYVMLTTAMYTFRYENNNERLEPDIEVSLDKKDNPWNDSDIIRVDNHHKRYDSHINIGAIQKRLTLVGYRIEDDDGYLGDSTYDALSDFMRRTGGGTLEGAVNSIDLLHINKFFDSSSYISLYQDNQLNMAQSLLHM